MVLRMVLSSDAARKNNTSLRPLSLDPPSPHLLDDEAVQEEVVLEEVHVVAVPLEFAPYHLNRVAGLLNLLPSWSAHCRGIRGRGMGMRGAG